MIKLKSKLDRRAATILVLTGLVLITGLILHHGGDKFVVPTAIGETDNSFLESEDFQYLDRANRAFINLVSRTRSSVVQITTKIKQNNNETNNRFRFRVVPREDNDRDNQRRPEDFWWEFFDREGLPNLPNIPNLPNTPNPTPPRGVGSGVIVSEDGYILTNNHVIENAEEITVTLANGKEYKAELIGSDSAQRHLGGSDLAVIKIDADDLSVLPFGDSDALEVGEWVIAIGTPLNYSQSVTRGIVSAKGRTGFTDYGRFIQTDAPINKGNSGGALINIRGELIGINTFIATGGFTTGNIGLGFAIPSNFAKQILPELIEKGEIVRGWLGISMGPVTHDLAEKLDLESPIGAFVHAVGNDSPAEKAGIERGDIILVFNNEKIQDSSHLQHAVGATAVGTSVKIHVLRQGEIKQLTAKIEKRTVEALATLDPNIPTNVDPKVPEVEEEKDSFAGMQVEKLTPELAKRYGHIDEEGVIVTKVEPNSSASNKGIQKGFLIKEIDYNPVNNLKDYEKIVKELRESDESLVLIYFKELNNTGHYKTLRIKPSDR